MSDLLPILVVDNQPDQRLTLVQDLVRVGFPVESAADASKALDLVKTTKYSLVIADQQSPEVGGIEVLHTVKKISPEIPVVVMAAQGTVHDAVEAMQAGACDYILKPFDFEILEKIVKRAIGSPIGKGGRQSDRDGPYKLHNGKEIITRNAEFGLILKRACGIAPSKATVLIQGESGTGKELLAAYIHRHCLHPEAPYVAINCAALPDTLAESELFGHEKGSFTGAVGRKIGKFEQVKKGTLVLDEISEMPLALQAKLLRVLQEREIDRIGGTQPIPIDARVVAISNIDLKEAVQQGKFREDLYYRINVIPLTIPPLRDRKEDIRLLANYFLEKYCRLNHKKNVEIDETAMGLMLNHAWDGNVRELENAMERAVLITKGPCILPHDLMLDVSDNRNDASDSFSVRAGHTVREMEKELIHRTLADVNDNRTQAAELLGISIRTLRNKLREYKEEVRAHGA